MITFLISILLRGFLVEAYPVFTFHSPPSSWEESPSYAYLVKDIHLPDKFTLCSSIKQARFDDVGFFTIHGQDSQEWLEMEFEIKKAIKLTVRQDKDIHRIGKLPNPRLDYWYHICMRMDLNGNKIEVAVNGRLLGKAIIDVTNMPNKLNMKLGVGYEWNQQFHGSVANTQMFSDGNLTALSSSPCESWPNTLLPWDPKRWSVSGPDWVLTEDFDDIFCNLSDSYDLAIPSRLSMQESLDICKHKMNNSIIPFDFEKDRILFLKYIKWHVNITGGACHFIWTPFSDEHSEGLFVNVNNNKTAELQFWSKTEPNGGRDENLVVIYISREALVDVPDKTLGCSSCRISSSLLLKLDGLCKHSMIGNV